MLIASYCILINTYNVFSHRVPPRPAFSSGLPHWRHHRRAAARVQHGRLWPRLRCARLDLRPAARAVHPSLRPGTDGPCGVQHHRQNCESSPCSCCCPSAANTLQICFIAVRWHITYIKKTSRVHQDATRSAFGTRSLAEFTVHQCFPFFITAVKNPSASFRHLFCSRFHIAISSHFSSSLVRANLADVGGRLPQHKPRFVRLAMTEVADGSAFCLLETRVGRTSAIGT